ncbi:hypothetical protein [Deinococcus fonticola]|uniref:hypothetical protein n=1 Tax=Deinococcus fonticola TaxID=2528713 RepID=UPI0010753773|nr:hypothetical protein [Deinococcus fonticola]
MDGLLNAEFTYYLFQVMRVVVIASFIHALVTKQELYWLFMLGFAVFFGGIISTIFALVYAFTVFLPWLRGRGRVAGQAARRGVEALKPLDTRIREAQALLDESDTLQRRADLAALQARAGRAAEAQQTLQPLLSGIYRDDPVVLLTSAELDLARGQAAEAAEKLNRVDLKTSAATRTRALTLLAQALDEQGQDASGTFEQAMLGATTEEPRARYAAYLIRQGRTEEARTLLDALEKTARQASPLYRRQEREWFDLALNLRKNLK